MARLIIEKGESFDIMSPRDKDRLEDLMDREFGSFEELEKELGEPHIGTFQLPPERCVDTLAKLESLTLPYVVTEWPLWGRAPNSGKPSYQVGIVKVVEYTWDDVKPKEE